MSVCCVTLSGYWEGYVGDEVCALLDLWHSLIEKIPAEDIIAGGQTDVSDRYMAPTVVRAVPEDKVMESEIFGPILPMLTFDTLEDIIDFINSRDKPLALYIFSSSSSEQKKTLTETSAGGVVVNDCIAHCGNPK